MIRECTDNCVRITLVETDLCNPTDSEWHDYVNQAFPEKAKYVRHYTATESFAERAILALDEAFRKLVLERRETNETLVMWVDNEVRHVPARDIKLPGE